MQNSFNNTQKSSFSNYGKELDRRTFYRESIKDEKTTYYQQPNRFSQISQSKVNTKSISPKSAYFFKTIERDQSPGFLHHYLPETTYENHYNPNFDVIYPQNPSFTIQKQKYTRQIHDQQNLTRNQTFKKDDEIQVCSKNSFLKKTLREFRSQSLTKTSNVFSDRTSKTLNKTKIKLSTLNELQLSEVKRDIWPESTQKLVQLDKQSMRFKQEPHQDYQAYNTQYNYDQNKNFLQSIDSIHPFESYSKRIDNFAPKYNPTYDLRTVNYDRILPREKKGYVEFKKYPNHVNQRTENMDPQPMGRLEYPNKEDNFRRQCVKNLNRIFMNKQTQRKQSVDGFWPKQSDRVMSLSSPERQKKLQLKNFQNYKDISVSFIQLNQN